jgi:hypothetical protein
MSETPKPDNFLLPASPLFSSLRPLHAEMNSACSGRIIHFGFGRASSGPAHMAGLDLTRPPFKKKIQNFQKNILKKL